MLLGLNKTADIRKSGSKRYSTHIVSLLTFSQSAFKSWDHFWHAFSFFPTSPFTSKPLNLVLSLPHFFWPSLAHKLDLPWVFLDPIHLSHHPHINFSEILFFTMLLLCLKSPLILWYLFIPFFSSSTFQGYYVFHYKCNIYTSVKIYKLKEGGNRSETYPMNKATVSILKNILADPTPLFQYTETFCVVRILFHTHCIQYSFLAYVISFMSLLSS